MTPGLCECGCGGKTAIATQSRTDRGWTRGRPKRFLSNHHRRSSPVEYVEEDRGYRTRCWIWQRYTTPAGYGLTERAGNGIGAHRAYFEDRHGPMPKELVIDHLCRVPACVNPDHLEAVTNAQNAQRGRKPKLNWARVRQLREDAAAGFSTRELAAAYGVSVGHIWKIVAGKQWVEGV